MPRHAVTAQPLPLFAESLPAMVQRQNALLNQYLACGAISDAAYRRSMGALRLHENVPQSAATQPTQPTPPAAAALEGIDPARNGVP
jgi:hypothetical protein